MTKANEFIATLGIINRIRDAELKSKILSEFAMDKKFYRAMREIICNLACRKKNIPKAFKLKEYNSDLEVILKKRGRKSKKAESMGRLGGFIKQTLPSIQRMIQ